MAASGSPPTTGSRSDTDAPIGYTDGDAVIFDDSAGTVPGGTTNVTINTGNVSPGLVTFNNNLYPYTVSGAFGIVGAAGLTVNGTSGVTLSTSNSYSGPTTINAGTLTIGNGGATGTLGSGPVVNNSVLAFSRSDNGLLVANAISGSGSVLQLGPGMTTLSGSNSYSGGTTISGGVLSVSTGANLGAYPGTVQPANITLNGGTLQFTAGTPVNGTQTIGTNRGITLGPAGGTINVDFVNPTQTNGQETCVWYSGVITGSGGLTITGIAGTSGTAASNQSIFGLNGNANYTGGTTVNNAILEFANVGGPYNNVLPAGTILNLVNSGAFNIDAEASTQTVAGLTGDATGQVGNTNQGSNSVFTINSVGSSTFNGIIAALNVANKLGSNSVLSLVLTGTGSQTLTNGKSLYANGTIINGGVLVVANSTNGSATGTGLVTINSTGVLASDPTVGGTVSGSVMANFGGTIAPGGLNPVGPLGGALNIGGSVSLAANSTLNFDLNGNTVDPLNISGLLAVNAPANLTFNALSLTATSYTLATFNANSGLTPSATSDFNYTPPAGYALAVSSSSLMLIGSPSVPAIWQGTLSTSWTDSANWNTGAVPSGQGVTATVGSATANPVAITLDGPQTLGQLILASASASGYTLAAGNGGSLTMNNAGNEAYILVTSGSHGITAPVILAGALSIDPTAGTTLNISGNISEQSPGIGSLSVNGPGTLILGGSDTYSNGTSVNAGTLIITSSNALPSGSSLTVAGGATFIYDPSVAAAPAAGGGAILAASPAGVAAVPEPGSLALLIAGLIVGIGVTWRRRKRIQSLGPAEE